MRNQYGYYSHLRSEIRSLHSHTDPSLTTTAVATLKSFHNRSKVDIHARTIHEMYVLQTSVLRSMLPIFRPLVHSLQYVVHITVLVLLDNPTIAKKSVDTFLLKENPSARHLKRNEISRFCRTFEQSSRLC